MDYSINQKVIDIIDSYMNQHNDANLGMERFCNATFKSMCETVFHEKCSKLISVKGTEIKQNAFDKKYRTYFKGNSWYQYSWYSGRCRWGYTYLLKGKCELYFQKHAGDIINLFISETYISIENAILTTDCYLELWDSFASWFDDRRKKFMEKMEIDIQKVKEMSEKKTLQSHGGVANLLKVLTKTMEKQGSDIASIAKVQYAICVQAGIYIPDEFIRDVAITLDMPVKKESEE